MTFNSEAAVNEASSIALQLRNRLSNIRHLRQDHVFELRSISDKRVGGSNAAHRSVEVFEEFVRNARRDFRPVAG